MKIKITDIDWDTDGEEVDLPAELELDINELYPSVEDCISDWLSDRYDFCHNGFKYKFEEHTSVDKEPTDKTTLKLGLNELKTFYTFFHEAVNFGDDRAVEWRDKIGKLIEGYSK